MKQLLFVIFLIHPLTIFAELNNITSHPNWKLLNPDKCGISNSDRIVGGNDAPLGAYPWLARIGYLLSTEARSAKPDYECGGAIINKFYIITAAHCSTNLPKNMVISRVLLGEHDTRTNPDCIESSCNDPYREYFVDKVIVHEKFDPSTVKNDIALLRVETEIEFTDFIRPICIIKGRLLEKDFVGDIAEVAGWGFTDSYTGARSNLLQTLKVPVRPVSFCARKRNYKKYKIDSFQMCVGGIKGQDSCSGDSGGPLMKVELGVEPGSPRYFIIGLVSFGLKYCGSSDTPGVYTNLSKYLLWVLDHLRA